MFVETKQWVWAQWGGVSQQWSRWLWVTSAGIDVYKHSIQAFVHRWEKNAQVMELIMLKNSGL